MEHLKFGESRREKVRPRSNEAKPPKAVILTETLQRNFSTTEQKVKSQKFHASRRPENLRLDACHLSLFSLKFQQLDKTVPHISAFRQKANLRQKLKSWVVNRLIDGKLNDHQGPRYLFAVTICKLWGKGFKAA